MQPDPGQPSEEERRRAACRAMASAPGLVRYAARFTRSLHDAEDAYQRTMEIALLRAPTTEEPRFTAWLHTVLRNEALAVARARRRETPGHGEDVALTAAEALTATGGPEASAEWRERYRAVQDALSGLTESQRVCLMLQSAGASYERIADVTGYSRRKVERSVLEGRAALYRWEVRLASGAVCERLDPLIDKASRGEATAAERRKVARHVRHCNPCRALLRSRRESTDWLASLVPIALLAGEALRAGPADPTPLMAYWERLTGGATVRAGIAVQTLMEMPSAALARVGAGTAAVVVAGAAGAPILADAVRPGPPAPVPVAQVALTAPQTEEVSVTTSAATDVRRSLREREGRRGAGAAARRPRVVVRERPAPARVQRRTALEPGTARHVPAPPAEVGAPPAAPPAPMPAPAPIAPPPPARAAVPAPAPSRATPPVAPAASDSQVVALEFGP